MGGSVPGVYSAVFIFWRFEKFEEYLYAMCVCVCVCNKIIQLAPIQ